MSEEERKVQFNVVKHHGNNMDAPLPAAIEICPSHGRSFYHVMRPSHRDVEMAQFIALACNSHYELLAALESCERHFTATVAKPEINLRHPIHAARAAIAKINSKSVKF